MPPAYKKCILTVTVYLKGLGRCKIILPPILSEEIWAIGSAEDLPPRFRPNPRGNARTPPGSARIRRTSAKNIFRRTPPNVRRTFGGHRRTPRGYGRIRAESAANWRKSSLEKCPPTKTYLKPLLLAEKLPQRTTVRRGNISRVRVRVRVGVRV